MTKLHWRDTRADDEGFAIKRSQDLTTYGHHIRVWRVEAGVWSWGMHRPAGELPADDFQPSRKLAQAAAQRWMDQRGPDAGHPRGIRVMHLGYPTRFLANTSERTTLKAATTEAPPTEQHTTEEPPPAPPSADVALAEKIEQEMQEAPPAPTTTKTKLPHYDWLGHICHTIINITNAHYGVGKLSSQTHRNREHHVKTLLEGAHAALLAMEYAHPATTALHDLRDDTRRGLAAYVTIQHRATEKD